MRLIEEITKIIMGVVMVLAIVALVFFVLLTGGCTRQVYVPVESVRTEYRDNIRDVYTTDSIVDTRFIWIKGDTVVDYRDRIKWRDREVHDSIYINLTDTVRMPYPVERKLGRWEQAKMDFGGMAISATGVLFIALCIAVVWLTRKGRR